MKNLPIETTEVMSYKSPKFAPVFNETKPLKLTHDQVKALEKIFPAVKSRSYHAFLLHGIPDSGKTEVYIRAIEYVLKLGKTVIFLVPEISLTPQTVDRLRERLRLGGAVVCMHSKLTKRERTNIWYGLYQGIFRVVIGPRSAIFSPLKNVGVIIVDEEHDASYKELESPRYSARDVALIRARLEKCVCIFGSATPSVETYYRAQMGELELIELTERVTETPPPKIHIVDMRGAKTLFSSIFKNKLIQHLKRGEKAMVLLNRRGYANYILCSDCGYVAQCKNCSITLTYHKNENILKCHYCGYEENLPDVCPECGSSNLTLRGIGIERIKSALQKLSLIHI